MIKIKFLLYLPSLPLPL